MKRTKENFFFFFNVYTLHFDKIKHFKYLIMAYVVSFIPQLHLYEFTQATCSAI